MQNKKLDLLSKLAAHIRNYEAETSEFLGVIIHIPTKDGEDEYTWDGEKFIKN